MNIQKSVIKISIISCLIPIIFLGMYSFFLTKREAQNREEGKIEFIFRTERQRMTLINEKVEGLLNIMELAIINDQTKSIKSERLAKDMMDCIAIDNKEVKNIFYADYLGNFYLEGIGRVTEGFDPRKRSWYAGALKKNKDYYITDVYRFSDGDKGITMAKAIYSKEKFMGVVGIDLSFTEYQSKMSDFTIGRTGKLFILDSKGSLVLDAGKNNLNKKKLTLLKKYMDSESNGGISSLYELLESKKEVTLELKKFGDPIFLRLEIIPEFRLIMVGGTYVEELKELPFNIIKAGIIISLIGMIISLLIINSFSKKLKVHLKNLSVLIEGISNGNYTKNVEKMLFYISDDSELNIIKKEVKNVQKNVREREKKLQEIAKIDNLTGVYNRKSLNTFLKDEIVQNRLFQSSFSIIMFDLDNFKKINDTYGHVFGDLVLKETTKIFLEETSRSDKVCRYGGEEFIIILPQTNKKEGFKVGERLRKKIEKKEFIDEEKKVRVTISGGVVEYEKGMNIKELIERVDKLLYKAKKNGKNKILC